MSVSAITDEIRASASEMHHGDALCQEKSKFLMTEMGLPNGLLPLQDMVECGYVKETGFVWLISKKKTEHKFEKINKLVQYASEVTAYVEPNRIKKLTGVKAKELLLWITLSEIKSDTSNGTIVFKSSAGLFRTFPFDAFVIDDDAIAVEKKETTTEDVKEEEEIVIDDDHVEGDTKDVKDEIEKTDLVPPHPVDVVESKNDVVEVKEV